MDTRVAEPTVDDVQSYQARLPGEPDPDRPSDASEPLRADERTAAARKGNRRSGLLSGVAIIAVVVIASGSFLLSPYNTVLPVPPALKLQVARLLRGNTGATQTHIETASTKPTPQTSRTSPVPSHIAPALPPAVPQGAHLDILAPAASLAAEKPQAALPPVKPPPYVPPPPQDEVAELEGFQPGHTTAAAPVTTPAQTVQQQAVTLAPPAAKPVQLATPADGAPPGYVPHEPGGAPESAMVTTHPTAPESAKPTPPLHPLVPAAATAETTSQKHVESTTAAVKPSIVATPTAALAEAAKLEAAPMSAPEQVQVLELVTQLATLVRDERTQIYNLQADQLNARKTEGAKLSDFERRLALVEASQAMASASNTPASAVSPTASPMSPTAVALTSARAALKAASRPPETPAPAAAPTSVQPLADQQMMNSDPSGVTLADLYGILHATGSFVRIPAAVFIGLLAILCFVLAAPSRFKRNFDVEGLLREEGGTPHLNGTAPP